MDLGGYKNGGGGGGRNRWQREGGTYFGPRGGTRVKAGATTESRWVAVAAAVAAAAVAVVTGGVGDLRETF